MNKLMFVSIFMSVMLIYGCNTNFNNSKNNISDNELKPSVIKFVNANGKIAYEITDQKNTSFSDKSLKSSKLSIEDTENLHKILVDIDKAAKSKSLKESINNLLRKFQIY